MNTNEFGRSCKQLRKKYNFEMTEEFMEELQELFIKSIGENEDFSLELMEYCMSPGDVEDKDVEKLSDMVDLFHLNYNDEYNQLEMDDWVFLKDHVNGWAQDMDMDTVTYVMQLVVDAGVFNK